MYKIILITILWIATFADFLTFYYGKIFQFEANPVYLLTGSILIILLVKFATISALTWMFCVYKPHKTYLWAYALVFLVVIAITLQCLGAVSNVITKQKHTSDPVNVVPLEQKQAITTYMYMNLLIFYLPFLISMLSFWLFERMYLKGEK